MSLLLKALAQIGSRAPADISLSTVDEFAAPQVRADDDVTTGPAEVKKTLSDNRALGSVRPNESAEEQPTEKTTAQPAVICLDSATSLAAEFSSAIPSRSEVARPSSTIISEADAFGKLPAIDSTLQLLSDLCQAIDADVAHPALLLPVQVPAPSAPHEPVPAPAPRVVVVKSPPTIHVPNVSIRDEYRVLVESIANRLPLTNHATLLFVDGGQVQTDLAWLWVFAACVLKRFSIGKSDTNAPPHGADIQEREMRISSAKVLIVEAAGAECGIASALGLNVEVGLSEVLQGTTPLLTAIQETFHPQIRYLATGSNSLKPSQSAEVAKIWTSLSSDFDLLLVAGGPLSDVSVEASMAAPSAAEIFLPLATGVILCVELDGTPVATCHNSRTHLEAIGANLLGCVVRGDIAA
jgi:Mrp family chromosome partitioning ATPase